MAKSVPIVTISGAHSNVGKTMLMEKLLGALKDWSAVKVTTSHSGPCPKGRPCGSCDDMRSRFSIVSDEKILMEESKDTARFKAAGARRVLWLKARPEGLKEGLRKALSILKSARGVLIEGTSILKYLEPDLAILVRNKNSTLKPSAKEILNKIDLVVTA